MSRLFINFFSCAVFVMALTINPTKLLANEEYLQEMLDELDLSKLDEKISFSELVNSLVSGDTDKSVGKKIAEYLYDQFFYEIEQIRPVFFELVGMALLFSLFGRVIAIKSEYVSELGFFVVYTGIMLLLFESFSTVGDAVSAAVADVNSFMSAFVPTYAAALFMTGNTASAGVFYELAFALIYLIELAAKILILPGIHYFVLILIMDDLFSEARLTKLSGLFEDGLLLLMKLAVGLVAGLGVVESLVAPAQDKFVSGSLYRGLAAIPGVGNAIGSAAELVISCGVVVKNCLGAAALISLSFISLVPIIKVFSYQLMYRFAAAVLEPFCDSRISDCVHDVGRGCALYLRLILTVLLLFWITTGLITAGAAFIN